jgi:hypothetical protein
MPIEIYVRRRSQDFLRRSPTPMINLREVEKRRPETMIKISIRKADSRPIQIMSILASTTCTIATSVVTTRCLLKEGYCGNLCDRADD